MSDKKPGFFSRLAQGLKRSSSKLGESVTAIFTKRKLDREALDELEDVLIAADLGSAAALRVTERLARDRFDKEVSDEEVREALAEVVAETLQPLERPLDLSGPAPQVVLFVGVNGSGKTTLLLAILDQLEITGGSIIRGSNTKIGYLDQARGELNPKDTVREAAVGDATEIAIGEERLSVGSYLERFLFDRKQQRVQVAELSGGERARVCLARLLAQKCNLLLLDDQRQVITLGRQVRDHQSRVRPIGTGDGYAPPPPLQGQPPDPQESDERWRERLQLLPVPLRKALQQSYQGISPPLIRQLAGSLAESGVQDLEPDQLRQLRGSRPRWLTTALSSQVKAELSVSRVISGTEAPGPGPGGAGGDPPPPFGAGASQERASSSHERPGDVHADAPMTQPVEPPETPSAPAELPPIIAPAGTSIPNQETDASSSSPAAPAATDETEAASKLKKAEAEPPRMRDYIPEERP